MRSIFRQTLYLILFWFSIYFIGRIVFYLCVTALLKDVSFSLILQSLYHGLRLDMSMNGYILALPVLLLVLFFFVRKKFILTIIDVLICIYIVIYSMAAAGEACLYREWKTKLNMQALEHFINPSEVFKSASLGLTVLFFSLTIIFSWIYIRFFRRKISFAKHINLTPQPVGKLILTGFLFLVGGAAVSIISIRGGLQAIPIQSSDSYFCTTPIINDAAVNPLWNVVSSILEYEMHNKENPYKDFDQAEADKITRSLYEVQKDTTISFLTTQRPNIVFILMESWSANCVKSFGGDNYAPFIDSLSKEGIYFSKFYPAGYVSDQGIPGVLSGYPSISRIAIINQNSKSVPLPCINQDLKKQGYQSGFVFGGDLNYGNIRSYVYNKNFDFVKEEKDFESSIPRGKLGIQDGDMATQYSAILNAAKQPFVYAWFTLSSHMPYDHPGEKKQLEQIENEYTNSVTYSDKSIGQFFAKAKQAPWYKNTLFVIVADHSHACHKNFSVYDSEYHRIPCLFFGDVIKPEFKGKNVEKVFSQLDITYSLLKQMGLQEESKQYVWSKDMFNPYTRPFAFYCSYSGAGFVSDKGFIGYQHDLKELVFNTLENNKPLADSLTRFGKAFQQSVYEDYRLK